MSPQHPFHVQIEDDSRGGATSSGRAVTFDLGMVPGIWGVKHSISPTAFDAVTDLPQLGRVWVATRIPAIFIQFARVCQRHFLMAGRRFPTPFAGTGGDTDRHLIQFALRFPLRSRIEHMTGRLASSSRRPVSHFHRVNLCANSSHHVRQDNFDVPENHVFRSGLVRYAPRSSKRRFVHVRTMFQEAGNVFCS